MEPFIPIIALLISIICLWQAFRARKRQRLISDLPTSKTTGVFVGLNEIKGQTRSAAPLTSYLAETACVYYRYTIEERWSRWETETYTDSNGDRKTRRVHKSGWSTVEQQEEMQAFELEDDHGRIRILPSGANIEPEKIYHQRCGKGNPLYYGKGPARSIMDSDGIRQFTEYAIPLNDTLYILGDARERSDMVAAEIASSKHAPYFLISTRSEETIVSGKAAKFWGLSLLGAVPPGATLGFIQSQGGTNLSPILFAVPLLVYFLVWLVGWAILIFNSLTHLTNRLRQAESLIDIQLKRRSDLVPNLVAVVKTLKAHNQELLVRLAALRKQQQHGLDDSGQPLFVSSGPVLKALREDYPALNSQDSFLHLQQELIDTENRIELARRHYNEVASFWNTRREILPDAWLMPLLKRNPAALFETGAAEQNPIEVSL